jgi:hypothetical protein
LAICALRILVRKSAIGSVTIVYLICAGIPAVLSI